MEHKNSSVNLRENRGKRIKERIEQIENIFQVGRF